jgi:ribA/ribD-fused uncharacterized protein
MATRDDSLPLNVSDLRRAVDEGRVFRYRFFWGHKGRADGACSDAVFSQFWPCRFEVDGQIYSSAEQFMMAEKARTFGDAEVRRAILATHEPPACKALGRTVRGFDAEVWSRARVDLVVRGNVAKFGQEPRSCAYLLSTLDDILVEASPRDTIWGIGLGRDSPRARDPRTWRGQNLLGFALVRVRSTLRKSL